MKDKLEILTEEKQIYVIDIIGAGGYWNWNH